MPVTSAFGIDPEIRDLQFISYNKIPTWVGVAANWQSENPKIHIYDRNIYAGHANYISRGLKTGISFKQFKKDVRYYKTRKYMPFMLFDLTDLNVFIDKTRYEWAVRIVDYEYRDTRPQMAKTVLKLASRLDEYMNSNGAKHKKGIFILATSKKSRPNTSIAGVLNKNGYPDRTVYQLLKMTMSERFKIMTPGTGAGYVRYVKAESPSDLRLTHKDIVIYEILPNRVPPVAGIITLMPQTPLSHVNLLAKNRGTFNVYTTDIDYIPGLEEHIGKLVRIRCQDNKVDIADIDEKQAETFWKKNKKLNIDIPTPNRSVQRIIDLGSKDTKYHDVKYIGAKAANYALIQAAFPEYVRPGFALPFRHYFDLIRSCEAKGQIQDLVKRKKGMNIEERNSRLAGIRQQIMRARLHPSTVTAIRWLQVRQFPRNKIRLRSSTNCEDLPQFNGAGLYISKGLKATQGNRKLMRKILEIYASLWSDLAFEEREFYHIDHLKAAMAILINEAFVGESANGVAITIPGADGYGILINAQSGENQVTNPKSGQTPESIFFKSHTDSKYHIETRSNIADIFAGSKKLEPILHKLKELVIKCRQILVGKLPEHERQRYGVDIEYKIMPVKDGYRLYMKQLRLLGTALPG